MRYRGLRCNALSWISAFVCAIYSQRGPIHPVITASFIHHRASDSHHAAAVRRKAGAVYVVRTLQAPHAAHRMPRRRYLGGWRFCIQAKRDIFKRHMRK